MLASIYIGMTGLSGFSAGLRVIANNTANLNTPGYKESSLQFSDLFYGDATLTAGTNDGPGQLGFGLSTNGTVLNFQQGELRQTGNDLDLAISGQGMFALKDDNGAIHYTRAGQFEFDSTGKLVDTITGYSVMGLGADGTLNQVSVAAARTATATPTTTIKFDGNLPSSLASQTVSGIRVYDSTGALHTLSAQFTSTTSPAGGWNVSLMDGATTVGTGQVVFSNGTPTAASAKSTLTYTPAGGTAMPLTLDFSTNVTSFSSGNLSTLEMSSQDGFGPSALSGTTFDATGTLILTYANGQTVKGPRLALARFDSPDAVVAEGSNEFKSTNDSAWHLGLAGDAAFGSIRAKNIEISNVDLSQEFSDLVIMQRGYQASSQIVSTANDMLQELFSMKGK